MNIKKSQKITYRMKDHLKLFRKISFDYLNFSKSNTMFEIFYEQIHGISLNKNTFIVFGIQKDDIESDTQVDIYLIKKIGGKELKKPTLLKSKKPLEKILIESIEGVNYKDIMALFKSDNENFKYCGYLGRGAVSVYTRKLLLEKLSSTDYFGFDLTPLLEDESVFLENMYEKIYPKENYEGEDFVNKFLEFEKIMSEKVLEINQTPETEDAKKIINTLSEKLEQKRKLEEEIKALKSKLDKINAPRTSFKGFSESIGHIIRRNPNRLTRALDLELSVFNHKGKVIENIIPENYRSNKGIEKFLKLKFKDLCN